MSRAVEAPDLDPTWLRERRARVRQATNIAEYAATVRELVEKLAVTPWPVDSDDAAAMIAVHLEVAAQHLAGEPGADDVEAALLVVLGAMQHGREVRS